MKPNRWMHWLPGLPGILGYLLFFMLPVALVFSEALAEPLVTFNRMISDRYLLASLWGSLALSLGAGIASLAVALCIAHFLSRCSDNLRQWLSMAIALPLVFSGLIVAYGFILTFGRAGFVTQLLGTIGIPEAIFGNLIFTPVGLGLAYCYYLIPRAVFILLPVMLNFDWKQLQVSESFGASRFQSYRYIFLPQLYPAMITSLCVMVSVALGAYGTALALSGTQLNILPLTLYSKISDGGTDFPVVGMLSIVLVALCVLFTLFADYLNRRLTVR
ncbi:ABC transporter permease [Marinobacterium lutimaris]|uniref:Putative spermidine/putrescine transport system permease protein n=1 Tax=Marinobacterium lutimaris TaxID=568106 RepID=A0A1H6DND5_9GAMM|nr:ABC transporter permease subunit [Marinobacterium lutimaris]SEG86075.1 putative spermidine/putrescine transport system permease protein [Marinobacterium lutimaris]